MGEVAATDTVVHAHEIDAPQSSVEERAKLRTSVGRLDIFSVLLCALVGLDTIGAFANQGAEGLTWFVFLAIAFFVPAALLTAELGSAFPAEGGPYVWARLAFGRLIGSITAILYWSTNPLWLGGSLTILAVATMDEFLVPLDGPTEWAFAVAFIWITIWAVIASGSVGRWLPIIGAFTRIIVLSFFAISVAVYLVKNGTGGALSWSGLAPSYQVFIASVPILLFKFAGSEVGSNAAEEMENPQRDVPLAVLRSGIATMLLYGIPIVGILLVLPADRLSGLDGFLDAMKEVFTVYGGSVAANGDVTLTGVGDVLGDIVAVAFILALASSAGAWIGGADRALATSCFDAAGPLWLGRISARTGTPVRVNLLSGIVATITMAAAFALTGSNSDRYFSVALGIALSTTVISYLFVYPSLARLRRMYPETPRPFRVPGGIGVARFVCWLATFWIVVGSISLIWPGFGTGWFGTKGDPGEAISKLGFGGQRFLFELTQIVPLVLIVLVGVAFWWVGRRQLEPESVASRPSEPPTTVAPEDLRSREGSD
jgi:amino acid transporter